MACARAGWAVGPFLGVARGRGVRGLAGPRGLPIGCPLRPQVNVFFPGGRNGSLGLVRGEWTRGGGPLGAAGWARLLGVLWFPSRG